MTKCEKLITALEDWSDGPNTEKLCREAASELRAQQAEILSLRLLLQTTESELALIRDDRRMLP